MKIPLFSLSRKIINLSLLLSLVFLLLPSTILAATPEISLSPDEGEVGEWIAVSGSGFAENMIVKFLFSRQSRDLDALGDSITIYADMGTSIINSGGQTSSDITFKIPQKLTDGEEERDVRSGTYYVYACYYSTTNGCSNIVALTEYSVLSDAEIELSIEEGNVDSEIIITGDKFNPEQEIFVRYDDTPIDIVNGTVIADNEGAFECAIIVPKSTFGEHTITVRDTAGNAVDTNFYVRPLISINPQTQEIDGAVKITGYGFGDNKEITVTIDGHVMPPPGGEMLSNHMGSFSLDTKVPFNYDYTNGATAVIAASGELTYAETTLEIPAVDAAIHTEPETSFSSPGYPGITVAVSGIWFEASSKVNIYYDEDPEPVASTTTEFNRSFSTEFEIPQGIGGEHKIIASDDNYRAETIFYMEETAPDIPLLIAPEITENSEDTLPRLTWQEISDPSGVSYTLQVALNSSFDSILLEKAGITNASYTFGQEEETLLQEQGDHFYWRIKAIDGAQNESDWSVSSSFYVNAKWSMAPMWANIGLIFTALALVGVTIFWVRKFFVYRAERKRID